MKKLLITASVIMFLILFTSTMFGLSTVNWVNHFKPHTDGTHNLGTSSFRFNAFYVETLYTGQISPSNDTFYFGEDGDGDDVYFYGDDEGAYMYWDESDDRLEFPGGVGVEFMEFGSFSSTAGSSGVILSATNTRIVDIHGDDGDVARAQGTFNSCLRGRFMSYAGGITEDYAIHGLVKYNGASVGGFSAGIMGAVEAITSLTVEGTSRDIITGVLGRVGFVCKPLIAQPARIACLTAFGNNPNTYAHTGTGKYVGILITETNSGTPEDFDYGLEILGDCITTADFRMHNEGEIGNTTDNQIFFKENDEDLILAFATDAINISSSSGVATVDFGTINLATDGLDLSDGNITSGGQVDVDLLDCSGSALQIGDGDETIYLYSSDWAIGTTGDMTGIGAITADGVVTFSGAYTSDVIDFASVTIDHTGSGGPCLIRAGSYGTPISSADNDQSGMIRLYNTNSATSAGGTGYYDRGIFVCLKTTGTKAQFPIAGLCEVKDVGGSAGPTAMMASQFIAHLNDAGAKLAALVTATDGMYGGWFKITANSGATTASGSRAAPLWVDNQLYGSNINAGMEEYGLFNTTGGTRPDAWAGFETTSSGYDYFLLFDETFNSGAGTCVTTDAVPGTQDARIKVYYDGKAYYIPLYR